MTINNVSIGDVFQRGQHHKAQVVDILEKRSLKDGTVKGYICIAKSLTGLSTNEFETPFSTVARSRIQENAG